MTKQHGILFTGKKLLLALFVSATISFSQAATLVDAIAVIVNDEPITIYDIEKKRYQNKISKEEALNKLIDEVIYKELIEKHNITADIFDVNNYIEKIAASNGMDLYTFKSILKQKYQNYEVYEEQVRNTIIKEKLTEKLIRGNIEVATDEDLRIYYENNQSMFTSATNVKVVQYASPNKNELEQLVKNPMSKLENVSSTPLDLEQSKLNPQLRYIINETKIQSFTPIFTANQQYVTLLVRAKEGVSIMPYEDVKDRIFNIIMQDRQQKYLKDYFEKQRLSANIKIVR